MWWLLLLLLCADAACRPSDDATGVTEASFHEGMKALGLPLSYVYIRSHITTVVSSLSRCSRPLTDSLSYEHAVQSHFIG